VPFGLIALQYYLEPTVRLVLAGMPDAAARAPWLRAIHHAFVPGKAVLGTTGPVDAFTQTLAADKPTAYLCRGTACDLPLHSPEQLREKIAALA
jgi:uncharacterized protein YyaL (SSP411 family)